MEPLAISVSQAAAALGVSRSHMYRMAQEGEIPIIRLGERLLVPVTALRALTEGAMRSNDNDINMEGGTNEAVPEDPGRVVALRGQPRTANPRRRGR